MSFINNLFGCFNYCCGAQYVDEDEVKLSEESSEVDYGIGPESGFADYCKAQLGDGDDDEDDDYGSRLPTDITIETDTESLNQGSCSATTIGDSHSIMNRSVLSLLAELEETEELEKIEELEEVEELEESSEVNYCALVDEFSSLMKELGQLSEPMIEGFAEKLMDLLDRHDVKRIVNSSSPTVFSHMLVKQIDSIQTLMESKILFSNIR